MTCIVRGRPHAALPGLLLCDHHLEELGKWLREIEKEARRLTFDPDHPDMWATQPSMSSRFDGAGSSTLPSQRSPASLDAIVFSDLRSTAHGHRHHGPVCGTCVHAVDRRCVCPPLTWRRAVHAEHCPQFGIHPSCASILSDRDEFDPHAERQLSSALAVLHDLAEQVREGRSLARPTIRVTEAMPRTRCTVPLHPSCHGMRIVRHVPAPYTLQSERDLLTRHLEWVAAQPWVDEARDELRELRNDLLRITHNEDDEPLTGYCFRLVDGQECRGRLWPAEPKHSSGYRDNGPYRYQAVECERNTKHRWEGHELPYLALVLEQQDTQEAS